MLNAGELPLPPTLLVTLRRCYAEPHRHYHALAHVEALLRWLARYQTLALDRASIDAAIWFHDAVYDTRRQDNEPGSAAMAAKALGAIGWSAAAIERVVTLVLATQHHQADPADRDAWLFLDLDLSVLGQSAAHYAAYAHAVRAEYAWVEEPAYQSGHTRVLKGFLAREQLYRTPVLREAWTAAARRNLQNELAALSPAG